MMYYLIHKNQNRRIVELIMKDKKKPSINNIFP